MLHDDSVWSDAPTFNPEPTDWLDTDSPDDDQYDGCAVFSEYFPERRQLVSPLGAAPRDIDREPLGIPSDTPRHR